MLIDDSTIDMQSTEKSDRNSGMLRYIIDLRYFRMNHGHGTSLHIRLAGFYVAYASFGSNEGR